MWYPEARDSSPIVCSLRSSWKRSKMTPLPGRKGTRRSLWKRAAAAGLDEVSGSSCGTITSVRIPLPHFFAWTLELEPWVSLWSNHFVEEPTPPLAWASDIWVSLWANCVVKELTSPFSFA